MGKATTKVLTPLLHLRSEIKSLYRATTQLPNEALVPTMRRAALYAARRPAAQRQMLRGKLARATTRPRAAPRLAACDDAPRATPRLPQSRPARHRNDTASETRETPRRRRPRAAPTQRARLVLRAEYADDVSHLQPSAGGPRRRDFGALWRMWSADRLLLTQTKSIS
jgi:hypothetical protein